MKSSIIEVFVTKPFEVTLNELKAKIVANDFLLLHEINTKDIMAKQGIVIDELRQILFFHPNYMKQVLDIDPQLVNEVTLKIVLRSISLNETSISIPNPTLTMSDYVGSKELASELFKKIMSILSF